MALALTCLVALMYFGFVGLMPFLGASWEWRTLEKDVLYSFNAPPNPRVLAPLARLSSGTLAASHAKALPRLQRGRAP